MDNLKKYFWIVCLCLSLHAMEEPEDEQMNTWSITLTDLPTELIEFIVVSSTDCNINDAESFRNALRNLTLIHSTNSLFQTMRHLSINNLIKKLKLLQWGEENSRNFFEYMLEKSNSEEAYLLLLTSGIKIYICDSKNQNIDVVLLRKAIKASYSESAKHIILNGFTSGKKKKLLSGTLGEFVKCGNLEIVTMLLDLGINANSVGYSNNPVLFIALEKNHLQIAALLIQRGANVNAMCSETFKGPLLFMFCNSNSPANIEKLTLLLNNGANINLRGERGLTPLMQASCLGNIDVVILLLERGAEITLKNDAGNTALALTDNKAIKKLIKRKRSSTCCCS